MKTKIIDYSLQPKQAIDLSIEAFNNNLPIIFQTDTVFGFLLPLSSTKAKNIVVQLKGRDANKPFQILVSSKKQAFALGKFNGFALELAKKHWAGGLTIIVPSLLAKDEKVGLRFPKFPPIIKLIRAYKQPLFATSVNISGEKELNTVNEIEANFGGKVPLIVFSSNFELEKIASTVVEILDKDYKILRQGGVRIEP
ncbi:MAG: L-threonylcarbamoyladenylate synthase [Alphaproteobacteria bacterium]|jgi:L-threonylcarbamoyladenylate synthase